MTEMSPLRPQMIVDMTVRNQSPATQRSYVHAEARFGRFFNRSPERLGLEEVRPFQVHCRAAAVGETPNRARSATYRRLPLRQTAGKSRQTLD